MPERRPSVYELAREEALTCQHCRVRHGSIARCGFVQCWYCGKRICPHCRFACPVQAQARVAAFRDTPGLLVRKRERWGTAQKKRVGR